MQVQVVMCVCVCVCVCVFFFLRNYKANVIVSFFMYFLSVVVSLVVNIPVTMIAYKDSSPKRPAHVELGPYILLTHN